MSIFQSRSRQESIQKQQEIHIQELSDWSTQLVKFYFGPLIQEQIKNQEGSEKVIFQDYLNLIATQLGDGSDPVPLPAYLENARNTKLPELGLEEFRQALSSIFPMRANDPNEKNDTTQKKPADLGREIPVNIIAALQDALVGIPAYFYKENKYIPPKVEGLLATTLRRIEESLRHPLELGEEIIQLDRQYIRLLDQLSTVDTHFRLPLKPLVTAPLNEQDIDNMYAREYELQEARLARQILHSTGVILISGYRGVGKSTFVNKVLRDLKVKYVPLQTTHPRWHVVPIQISLAKIANVSSVLRYCIRSLYTLFLQNEELSALLYPDEKELLQSAYVRAAFRYSQEQSESAANAIETKAALKASLGDLIGSRLPLPSFEGNMNRTWGTKFAQSIALLDYDEDQAERDIGILIERLARERSKSWLKEQEKPLSKISQRLQVMSGEQNGIPARRTDSIRIKLVFVFDEMDKMDEETGQMPLVSQLKNLFLSRHAVFLLLTSKKFYYRWLADRRQEDSVLNSYFTSVTMVPMFTTDDTLRLLSKISKIPLPQSESESTLIFAQYLNYRAMGVPREILRELHEMQQWLPDSLQPYLTDRSNQFGIARIYSKIQTVLEELDKESSRAVTETNASQLEESDTNLTNDGNETETSSGEIVIAPERFWLNDGLREQLRRGRYVLVEQLLADGHLEWSESLLQEKDSSLQKIYKNNFALLSERDFLDQIYETATRLETIRVDAGEFPSLSVSEESAPGTNLFRKTNAQGSSRRKNRLFVDESFYILTGRSRNQAEMVIPNNSFDVSTPLSEKEIEEYLASNSLTKKQQALNYLIQQTERTDNLVIQQSLFQIFVSNDTDITIRTNAGKVLDGVLFLRMAKETNYEQYLRQEHNGEILQQVVALIREGTQSADKSNTGKRLLETLIRRGASSTTSRLASSKLSESLYIETVTALDKIGATEQSLALVVEGIERENQLPASLFSLLTALQKKSPDNLLELLVARDIRGLKESSIRELLSQTSDLIGLWSRLLPQKDVSLGQRALSEILVYLAQNSNQKLNQYPIVEWLNGASWTSADRKILDQAEAKPRVSEYLTDLIEPLENNLRAKSRVKVQNQQNANQTPLPVTSRSEDLPASIPLTPEEKQKQRRNRLLHMAGIVTLYAVFVILPTNLPVDATVGSRLIGRLLEILYLPFFVFGIFLIVDAVFDGGNSGLIGVILLALTGLCFYVLIAVLHHPLTFWGQALLVVLNLVGWVWFFGLVGVSKPSSS